MSTATRIVPRWHFKRPPRAANDNRAPWTRRLLSALFVITLLGIAGADFLAPLLTGTH